jgi:hypothetical protein
MSTALALAKLVIPDARVIAGHAPTSRLPLPAQNGKQSAWKRQSDLGEQLHSLPQKHMYSNCICTASLLCSCCVVLAETSSFTAGVGGPPAVVLRRPLWKLTLPWGIFITEMRGFVWSAALEAFTKDIRGPQAMALRRRMRIPVFCCGVGFYSRRRRTTGGGPTMSPAKAHNAICDASCRNY